MSNFSFLFLTFSPKQLKNHRSSKRAPTSPSPSTPCSAACSFITKTAGWLVYPLSSLEGGKGLVAVTIVVVSLASVNDARDGDLSLTAQGAISRDSSAPFHFLCWGTTDADIKISRK